MKSVSYICPDSLSELFLISGAKLYSHNADLQDYSGNSNDSLEIPVIQNEVPEIPD